MKTKKYFLVVSVLFVMGILVVAFIIKGDRPDMESKESKTTEISANYIDFSLVDKNGEQINLKDFQGKTIVLNFWASWCPPCIEEMPSIQKFYNDINKDDVKLVLVALDRDFNKSIKFMEKKGYNMPYYYPASNIPSQFDIRGIPITYVITGSGEIAITYSGMADYTSKEFIEAVETVNQ